jgi:hypothetical protein
VAGKLKSCDAKKTRRDTPVAPLQNDANPYSRKMTAFSDGGEVKNLARLRVSEGQFSGKVSPKQKQTLFVPVFRTINCLQPT